MCGSIFDFSSLNFDFATSEFLVFLEIFEQPFSFLCGTKTVNGELKNRYAPNYVIGFTRLGLLSGGSCAR